MEIVTDDGLTSWGEPVLEGHCSTVLYRAGFYRGGGVLMSAISGIDQALWDIKGKFFDAPVYQLMGGACRDNMKVYSWIGGDRPSDVGAAALEKMWARAFWTMFTIRRISSLWTAGSPCR